MNGTKLGVNGHFCIKNVIFCIIYITNIPYFGTKIDVDTLEEECGCSYYVMCLECGCHTVNIDFRSEQERLDAAKRAVMLWNTGKVISSSPGE